MSFFKSLIFLCLLSSCALAPISSVKTARSLQEGAGQLNVGIDGGLSVFGGYGITNKLDVGGLVEIGLSSNYGVWSRYNIIGNEDEGFSMALYGGASLVRSFVKGYSFFAGPVLSYKHSWFETFLIARFNRATWDKGVIDLDDAADSLFDEIDYSSGSLEYIQADAGFNFWGHPKFALNITGYPL